MANSELTFDQFKDFLLTYGVDTRRWPGVTPGQVETLLAASEEARALIAEYAPVDTLMQAGKDDSAPEGLLSRILDAIDKK